MKDRNAFDTLLATTVDLLVAENMLEAADLVRSVQSELAESG